MILIENLASYWIVSIIPEVVELNLGISKEENSKICGYIFSYFFFGMIAGSFVWPSVSRFISKRNCIMLGFILQAITNIFTGQTKRLYFVYFWRFIYGACHNLNTIGKSFIFDFAESRNRQIAFNSKSCASLAAACFGPLFGYYVYDYYQKDYFSSFAFISTTYAFGIILFFIVFYVYYDNLAVKEESPKIQDDEETKSLVKPPDDNNITKGITPEQKGIFEVIRLIFATPKLRNVIFAYLIVNGDYTVRLFLTIFYMETPWSQEGLGISTKGVSIISLIIFLPSIVLILTSTLFIPKKIKVFTFTKFVILMSILFTIMLPLFRDIFPNNTGWFYWIICVVFGLNSFFNPNLFSPFLNYYINATLDNDSRNSLNSITFIASSLSSVVLLALVSPLLSISLHNPNFTAHSPYSKYLSFVLLDVLQFVGLYLLRNHH